MSVINFLSCKYLMRSLALLLSVLLLSGCSSTSSLEEGEQLYVGIKDIEYKNYERNAHFITTREEIEAGLAAAPNGSFMGSSTICFLGGCGCIMPQLIRTALCPAGLTTPLARLRNLCLMSTENYAHLWQSQCFILMDIFVVM